MNKIAHLINFNKIGSPNLGFISVAEIIHQKVLSLPLNAVRHEVKVAKAIQVVN